MQVIKLSCSIKSNVDMKKITLLFTLALTLGVSGAYAQSCAKACTKKAEKQASTIDAETAEAAAKLASLDESIEKKVCPHSGMVSYVKTVKNDDGEVSHVDVEYDAAKAQFVNVSPKDMEKNCSAEKKAGCCASGAADMKSSDKEKTKAKKKS